MDEYEKSLKDIEDLQKKKLVQDLDTAKKASLESLTREEAIAKPQYTQQRADKNVASQIQKLNYAEFMTNRGQSNAGIANTAELSRQNMLSRNIGAIDTAERTQMTDIANRRADVNTSYNSNLASGNLAINADTATKLLAYREQLRQEEMQRKAADLEYQRSLNKIYASNSSVGGGFSEDSTENNEITTESPTFAQQYAEQLLGTGQQIRGIDLNNQLNFLINSGDITRNEASEIIAAMQSRGMIA